MQKAKKIYAVISKSLDMSEIKNLKILEIGCGNGEIIEYFRKNDNEVFAIDVYDQICNSINKEKINFKLVDSAQIPFHDKYFDIIISNHVVEHIKDQRTHLKEIRRCLKDSGMCYFATPNRNFFIEPHYRIPFIHYLPNKLFYKILKSVNKYEEDLYLLSYNRMKKLFNSADLKYIEYTSFVLKRPDSYNLEFKYFKFFPLFLLNILQIISPTNIFVLKKH